MSEAIKEILMTWAEDVYLGIGARSLYYSHQGNWHVTTVICEGYTKVIFDGPNFDHALTCFLDKQPILEVPADGPAVPSA